jgi:hypothetical protein
MLSDKKAKPVAPIAATVVGIVLVCLLLVLVSAKPNPSDNADSPLLGQPAPAVVTTTLEDKPFDLARRKGSWVVFNFFQLDVCSLSRGASAVTDIRTKPIVDRQSCRDVHGDQR